MKEWIQMTLVLVLLVVFFAVIPYGIDFIGHIWGGAEEWDCNHYGGVYVRTTTDGFVHGACVLNTK